MFWTIRLKKRLWLCLIAILCLTVFTAKTIAKGTKYRTHEPAATANQSVKNSGIYASSKSDKVVYLTFDDGPSKITEIILDVLKEGEVKATFFVMADSNNTDDLPMLRRTKDEGHLVALHTTSHQYKTIYESAKAYWQDLDKLRTIVEPFTGELPNLLRFPGGSTNHVASKAVMERLIADCGEKGYRYFDWNVCANDSVGKKKSAEYIVSTVIKEAAKHNTAIVLFHDSSKCDTTAEALPIIIKWFKENGYRFDTVNNLPVQ